MKLMLAIVAGFMAASVVAEGAPIEAGLKTLRGEVREELQWLESLEPAKVEALLKKHCPATLLLIEQLGKAMEKASADEKKDILGEVTGLIEDRIYLHREYRQYQEEKKAGKAKLCLQIFLLEDKIILAELDELRLQQKKAKPAQLKAKRREIEKLREQTQKLYDKLDAE